MRGSLAQISCMRLPMVLYRSMSCPSSFFLSPSLRLVLRMLKDTIAWRYRASIRAR
ncbi:MAG: hypothetical protein FD137_1677 [Spirochaetes bacterium]|nr:MAG: hypothetical protein FD137_1677 [Spirochaetota bacterium]